LHNLSLFAVDDSDAPACSEVFTKEEETYIDISDILDEVCDYSFEGDDCPEFVEDSVIIKDDGVVEIWYCTEGGGFAHQELTDYFCFAVQRAYGIEDSYSRCSTCDYSGGFDIAVGNIDNKGNYKEVYRSN